MERRMKESISCIMSCWMFSVFYVSWAHNLHCGQTFCTPLILGCLEIISPNNQSVVSPPRRLSRSMQKNRCLSRLQGSSATITRSPLVQNTHFGMTCSATPASNECFVEPPNGHHVLLCSRHWLPQSPANMVERPLSEAHRLSQSAAKLFKLRILEQHYT